jgi:hypothetical protein
LLEHDFGQNSIEGINSNIIGGLTTSMISFFTSMSVDSGKMDAIHMGDSKLNYFYDDQVIICLETDKNVKEKSVRSVLQSIHNTFVNKFFGPILKTDLVDVQFFGSFKAKMLEILKNSKFIPK